MAVDVAQPVDYLQARRPWLTLYGVRLKLTKVQDNGEVDLSLLQKAIPEELMLIILQHLGPYSLGMVACTCRQMRMLTEHPKLWREACLDAVRPCKLESDVRTLLMKNYRGSWKRMFLEHPHVRFDGIYVSRNSYVRQGVIEWTRSKSVHLVCYYRYYRFLPDGRFLYRTSPLTVSKVARSMKDTSRQEADVHRGQFVIKGSTAYCVVVYPNSHQTEVRSKLQLGATHQGAHNRLQIQSIHSYDRELGTATDIGGRDPDVEPEPDGLERRDYRRGMATLVFVHWDAVQSSPLNLPPSEMDFFIA